MWERGLKLHYLAHGQSRVGVAPHVGAWIETNCKVTAVSSAESLPMWERGLKQAAVGRSCLAHGSLPMWERGLKRTVRW